MNQELFEALKNDEELKSKIQDLSKNQTLRKEEAYQMITDLLSAKKIRVTDDDIDAVFKNSKKEILSRVLSDEELDAVSGGANRWYCTSPAVDCHSGSNSGYHPDPPCGATVEMGSWCGSNDDCVIWSNTYTWIQN